MRVSKVNRGGHLQEFGFEEYLLCKIGIILFAQLQMLAVVVGQVQSEGCAYSSLNQSQFVYI